MLFKQCLNGKSRASFTLIKDNSEISGLGLLEKLIESSLKNNAAVRFLSFEHVSYEFKPDVVNSPSYEFRDCFTNGWKWNKKDNEKLFDSETYFENEPKDLTVIVIDSLSSVLFNVNITKLITVLHMLVLKKNIQVIGILHEDVFDSESYESRQICHLASTVINLNATDGKAVLSFNHTKSKGKLIKEDYEFRFGADGVLEYEELKKPVIPVEPEEPLDMNITTFNLTLTEEEKQSRSNVVLPYLEARETASKSGKGQVFYTPDENDDFDEEDPDDDLDI